MTDYFKFKEEFTSISKRLTRREFRTLIAALHTGQKRNAHTKQQTMITRFEAMGESFVPALEPWSSTNPPTSTQGADAEVDALTTMISARLKGLNRKARENKMKRLFALLMDYDEETSSLSYITSSSRILTQL